MHNSNANAGARDILALYRRSPELFRDVSGFSGATTLEYAGGGVHLKIAEKGALRDEYTRCAAFSQYSLGGTPLAPRPLDYASDERDLLLTETLCGTPATDERFLSRPEALAAALGQTLRAFHGLLDGAEFQFSNSSTTLIDDARKGIAAGKFESNYTEFLGIKERSEACRIFEENAPFLSDDVITHGDYCLPNILFDDTLGFAGFLDLGGAGKGDRHFDIYWARWSLWYNLESDMWFDTFLDAYGRELYDERRLLAVACAVSLT